jgi:mycothiol system anti-sigma-R factor
MSHGDCDEALANLYQYLDTELDRSTTARIKAHLDDCYGCHAPFDFELRLRTVVRARLHEEVPDEVVDRIRTVLHEAGCPPSA